MSDDTEAEKAAAREERRESRGDLPAVFIDTWAFSTWQGHVRITLGEEIGNKDVYRSAFLMELNEAEYFANHLLKVIRIRREKEAAKKQAESAPEGDG